MATTETTSPHSTPAPPASPAPPVSHDGASPPVATTAGRPINRPRRRRLMWIGGIIVALAAIAAGIPWLIETLTTVSTDDAYVNGHFTFVAPRVAGQVLKVFVDDNNRVKKGDLLVRLDPEPFVVQVNIAQAAVDAANANLAAVRAQTRSTEAQARSLRFSLEHAIEDVDNQIALLHARVFTLQSAIATYNKAQADYDRAAPLVESGAVTKEDLDRRNEAKLVAQAQVEEARQGVYQIRVGLGLPPVPPRHWWGSDLNEVPLDLDQTFSTVREAQLKLAQAAAQLGYFDSLTVSPSQMIEDFYAQDPQGNLEKIYAELLKNAPGVKLAQTQLDQANANLAQAQLNLRYTYVVAEIDGVITRRDVNAGNNVVVGQSLMAIRSLTEVWVDANFKETQLAKLKIGLPVDLDVDMYGSKHRFRGRISGFTMGTGSTLSLLPAENATGNFVKVVQRLPVRIDLVDYKPDVLPLFIGLSVTPHVYTNATPTDPDAGKVLQPNVLTPVDTSAYVGSGPPTAPTTAPAPATVPAPTTSSRAGVAPMSSAVAARIVPLELPARRAINPWIIAIAVVIPTFMEVLDTTIANVALRYIAGGLSSPVTDSEWVITSYLAANAIILPISGYLSNRLGRRNYFLLSISMFTVASALCGMAGTLNELICFRVMQGLAGGGLQPSSQAVLLDAFPREKQGVAQTIFGIAALLAPVVGPTLGGYITDNYGWRWIFYLNVPVGLIAVIFCSLVVVDPDYLKELRAKAINARQRFDFPGLCLLAATMISWEVILSKGQEWDWFGDPFWRIQTLSAILVLGLGGLIWRELKIANPLINFRTLKERNFRACCIIIFCAFAVLYANTVTLPALLQTLFGYDATTSGLVLSPSGVFAVIVLFCVGILLSRGTDARILMAAGLLVLGIGNYWIAHLNLDISPWQVVWPRVVVIVGLSMLFAPLNVAAFLYIPREMRGAAVGLLALLRNEGGSVGTSIAQTIQERRLQFHTLRLNEFLDPLNPAVSQFYQEAKAFFLQHTGDPVMSGKMALQAFSNSLEQQAASLSYFDVFWSAAAISVGLVFLVLLMRRSVAEKGAHIGAE